MTIEKDTTLVIIGSGPAGLTAGIYAGRAGLSPIIISGNLPGGLLTTTNEVENYPGFPDPQTGTAIMARIQQQAERCGAELLYDSCLSVRLNTEQGRAGRHVLTLASGDILRTRALIIATGARPRELGLPEEQSFLGHGLSYCATCDGPFFRNRVVTVLGGGNAALEEALYLAGIASTVNVVHARPRFGAPAVTTTRIAETENIATFLNSKVVRINGNAKGNVASITMRDNADGHERELATDAVFVAIGHTADTPLFKGQLPLVNGCIQLPDPRRTATGVAGVFAAGNCVDDFYMQAVTAAAMGCKAAIDASKWLATNP